MKIPELLPPPDTMYRALVNRDSSFEGIFYAGVRTTGIFCRPTCTAKKGERVDEVRNGSGFESESGFRDAFTRIFGEPPTAAKAQGGLFAERIETPLGAMLAIADDEGLRLLEFVDRRAMERELSILRKRLRTNVVPGEHKHLEAARSQLADYFSGKNLEFNLPLAPVGSPFQLRAWELLRSIPTGETRSYSWMAKKLGDVEVGCIEVGAL